MYANAGNVDSYIASRLSVSDDVEDHTVNGEGEADPENLSAAERKKQFKKRRLSNKAESANGQGIPKPRFDARGVLLLSREELDSIFGDVVEGLQFLVSRLTLTYQELHMFTGQYANSILKALYILT